MVKDYVYIYCNHKTKDYLLRLKHEWQLKNAQEVIIALLKNNLKYEKLLREIETKENKNEENQNGIS